jgi:hypothetical protein
MSSQTPTETVETDCCDEHMQETNIPTSVYFPEKGDVKGSEPLWVLSIDGNPLSYTKTQDECMKLMKEYSEYLVFNCSRDNRVRLEYSHNSIHIIGSNKFSFVRYDKTLYYLTVTQILNCTEL